MKNKVKILLENILKESVGNQQDKPKIKLIPLWQDRGEKRLKQYEKILQQEVIGGYLELGGSLIENLGNVKHVKGDLYVSHCKNLTHLPVGLRVDGWLCADGCDNLKELPEGLIVNGDLILRNCISLLSLPKTLTIRGDLELVGCKNITSLPEGLKVGQNLWLFGCQQQVIDQAIQKFGDYRVVYKRDN